MNKVNSPALNRVRSNFSTASRAWQLLTPTQQSDWDAFALANPQSDGLGLLLLINGKTFFNTVYINRLTCGNLTVPLAPISLPTSPPGLVSFTIVWPFTIAIILDGLAPPLDFITVSLTRAQSLGAQAARDFGLAIVVPGNTVSVPILDAYWAIRFGTMPRHGRIFAKLVPINSDGWPGSPLIISAVIS